MASLMDDLLGVLSDEEKLYRKLIGLSTEKKDVIINAQIDRLEQITSEERETVDVLHNLELKRNEVLGDMAVVLRRDQKELNIDAMIDLLDKQPVQQKKLREVREKLHNTLDEMIRINNQNQMLIKQAMEMVEFDLTLFKSLRQAPETANYDKNAYNTGTLLGNGGFDAKQ